MGAPLIVAEDLMLEAPGVCERAWDRVRVRIRGRGTGLGLELGVELGRGSGAQRGGWAHRKTE